MTFCTIGRLVYKEEQGRAPHVMKLTVWSPLPLRVLKYNVDGVARGKPGPTGIEGVLRMTKVMNLGING